MVFKFINPAGPAAMIEMIITIVYCQPLVQPDRPAKWLIDRKKKKIKIKRTAIVTNLQDSIFTLLYLFIYFFVVVSARYWSE